MFWITLLLYILGIFQFSSLLLLKMKKQVFSEDDYYQAFKCSIFWPFLIISLFVIGMMNNNITKGK